MPLLEARWTTVSTSDVRGAANRYPGGPLMRRSLGGFDRGERPPAQRVHRAARSIHDQALEEYVGPFCTTRSHAASNS